MKILRYCFFVGLCASSFPGLTQTDFFDQADDFFKSRLVNNRINYKLLAQEQEVMDSLVAQIASMQVDSMDRATRTAFYINAYNLLVIKNVLNHYPLTNVRDVPGFFDKIQHIIAGEQLTLDEIEFQKLFKPYVDPRLHFVLNCGAYSCPTLFNEAIRPEELEDQLNFAITLVMDRDDYVFVDHESNSVYVSKIFDWYGHHFRVDGSIRQFINYHRFTSIPASYEIRFQEYNWRLNDSNNRASR